MRVKDIAWDAVAVIAVMFIVIWIVTTLIIIGLDEAIRAIF